MRIQRFMTLSIAYTAILTASSIAIAGNTISIKPGMWEMTTKMTTPMSPQPRVKTTKECMTQAEIGPQDLTSEQGDDCQITDSQVSDNSMTWSMSCNTPGGAMTGGGKFISKGSSGHGDMEMNMSIEGQSFNMKVEWEGKHIGSC